MFLRVEQRVLAAGVGSGSLSWAGCSGSHVEVARLHPELLFTGFALAPCSSCAVEIKSDESGSGSGCSHCGLDGAAVGGLGLLGAKKSCSRAEFLPY